jgi:hypothetical protein
MYALFGGGGLPLRGRHSANSRNVVHFKCNCVAEIDVDMNSEHEKIWKTVGTGLFGGAILVFDGGNWGSLVIYCGGDDSVHSAINNNSNSN